MPDIAAINRSRPLDLRRRTIGRRAVLAVGGEVDLATAPDLQAAIVAALDSGAGELWIDLGATTFMDSSGLHVLFAGHLRAEALRRRLTIICPPGPVRRLFEVTGFVDRLPLYEDLAAAHRHA